MVRFSSLLLQKNPWLTLVNILKVWGLSPENKTTAVVDKVKLQ